MTTNLLIIQALKIRLKYLIIKIKANCLDCLLDSLIFDFALHSQVSSFWNSPFHRAAFYFNSILFVVDPWKWADIGSVLSSIWLIPAASVVYLSIFINSIHSAIKDLLLAIILVFSFTISCCPIGLMFPFVNDNRNFIIHCISST